MSRIRKAGAIAMKLAANQTRVLLVTATDGETWIFPKGNLERGEEPADAALRELEEEADVRGEILDAVGVSRFRSGRDEVEVSYFLVQALTDGGPSEGRQHRWLPPASARARLTFEDLRELLDKAVAAWIKRQ